MTKDKKKFIFYIFIAIIVIGVTYILFNEHGALKYFSLKSEVDSMKVQLEKIKSENEQLRAEIDSLQKIIPAKIEQVAREKYNMKRKGETVIEVEER